MNKIYFNCNKCGSRNSLKNNFCGVCGAPFSVVICQECGHGISVGDVYCVICGTSRETSLRILRDGGKRINEG